MDTDIVIQIIVLLLLLLASSFFSSAETALTTVSRIKVKTLADAGNLKAQRVLRVTDQQNKMLSAILIGNNIVNLSASSLATILAMRLFGDLGAGIATGLLTLAILIFGEISPKRLAVLNNLELSLRLAPIVYRLMWLLTPVIFIVNSLSNAMIRLTGTDPHRARESLTEEELRTIVDVSQAAGVIEHEERNYIHKVFDFTDALVREVMIPRIDIQLANANWSYEKLISVFSSCMFTRLPVYEESSEQIIGIVNMKDLLLVKDPALFSLKDYLRSAYFTFELKNTRDLFEEMRQNSIAMAIVMDEYGAFAGIITMEDLLEELVGEIRDEYDSNEEDDLIQLTPQEYMVLGSMNLEDLMSIIPLGYESDDYDTIGGYLTGEFDHFPRKGETYVDANGAILRVERVKKNRIKKIRIKLPAQIASRIDEDFLPNSEEEEELQMPHTPSASRLTDGPAKPSDD